MGARAHCFLLKINSPEMTNLRGCVTAVQFILLNFANYSASTAMELKISKEIICK